MRLEIGKQIPPPYTNTFVCEIKTMMGDGDDYKTVVRRVGDSHVEDLENLFKALKKKGWDIYDNIPNFTRFFGVDEMEEPYDMDAEWPRDYDCDLDYCYRGHKYFWYDAEGRKYEAKLSPKEYNSSR